MNAACSAPVASWMICTDIRLLLLLPGQLLLLPLLWRSSSQEPSQERCQVGVCSSCEFLRIECQKISYSHFINTRRSVGEFDEIQ